MRSSYLDYLPLQLQLLLLCVHKLEFGIGGLVSQGIVLLLEGPHLHQICHCWAFGKSASLSLLGLWPVSRTLSDGH